MLEEDCITRARVWKAQQARGGVARGEEDVEEATVGRSQGQNETLYIRELELELDLRE